MSGSATMAAISKPASACRSKARLIAFFAIVFCPFCTQIWLRRRWRPQGEVLGRAASHNLAHEQERQSRAHRNQECPDKQFEPINRGDVARPQIVPTRHGGNPPSPWHNSTLTPNPSSGFRRARTIVLSWEDCFARVETAAAASGRTSDCGRQCGSKLLLGHKKARHSKPTGLPPLRARWL